MNDWHHFSRFAELPRELRAGVIGECLRETMRQEDAERMDDTQHPHSAVGKPATLYKHQRHDVLALRLVSREFQLEVDRQRPDILAAALNRPMHVCSTNTALNPGRLRPAEPAQLDAMRILLTRMSEATEPRVLTLPYTPYWASEHSMEGLSIPRGYGTRAQPRAASPREVRHGFATRCDFLVEAMGLSRAARQFNILVPEAPNAYTYRRVFASLEAPEQAPFTLILEKLLPLNECSVTDADIEPRYSFMRALPISASLTRLDLRSFALTSLDEQKALFDRVAQMRGLQELCVTLADPMNEEAPGEGLSLSQAHAGLRGLTGLQKISLTCQIEFAEGGSSRLLFSLADVLRTLTGLTHLGLAIRGPEGDALMLNEPEAQALFTALEPLSCLRYLVYKDNDASYAFLSAITRWLLRCHNVISLDLSYCGLTTKHLEPLMTQLAAQRKRLDTLLLHGPTFSHGVEDAQGEIPPDHRDNREWLSYPDRWLRQELVQRMSLDTPPQGNPQQVQLDIAALSYALPGRILEENDAEHLAWTIV